ncbi:MAG: glutamate-cysteine ligase family protein [Pirellulales bacterium]
MDESFPGLFEAFGVELEYMVVDAATLQIRPIVDALLMAEAGELVSEIDCGLISWSNELALHVLEFKTTEPATEWGPLADGFQAQVRRANELLMKLGARLMPTGMHPWMDPQRELNLWPHDYNPVYEAFHRIFDCRGHGWANLQSVHLNLPFRDGEEFGRLHAAIRLILPLLPALAASSPVVERRVTGILDNRLDFYRRNADRVPLVAAGVVPEAVFSPEDYEHQILQRLYRQIAPLDPEGILQHEWLNARGAIARFDRQTIEIRVLDVQECPAMDLALLGLVAGVLRKLVDQQWSRLAAQQLVAQPMLEQLFTRAVRYGRAAVVGDARFLAQFGWSGSEVCTVGQLWTYLADQIDWPLPGQLELARLVLTQGSLSERIRDQLAAGATLESVYAQLCDSLATGQPWRPN